jgi:glycine/D-amino acid oxidase-like deaminating enzyme
MPAARKEEIVKRGSREDRSVWVATSEAKERPSLAVDTQADVCVVGAGIAGMTTAYLLVRSGKSVVVLDDGVIGSGMTSRTTAHLVNALDDRYYRLEEDHGPERARLAAESHTAAIARIQETAIGEQIDCDFARLDGYLFPPPGVSRAPLERELAAAHRAGLTDVSMVDRAPIADFDTGPCLRFPRQAQFHPLKYLNGLARAIELQGSRIFNRTHVATITGGSSARVATEKGPVVSCAAVVVATNTPVGQQPVRPSHQTGALYDLCHSRAGKAECRNKGLVLGHRTG